MKTNIIIAGSISFSDYLLLEKTLDKYIQNKENITIISGTAKGADRLGEKYAYEHDIPTICCPADWAHFHKAAGVKRNEEMAYLSVQDDAHGVLFAFWNGESRGTRHMINIAQKYKLEIHIIDCE